jgi:hypothetical protein
MSHTDDQAWERDWWGTCANTYGEETKQLTYAYRMGLINMPIAGHWPAYDLGGHSVLDLGGGPASILLKTVNGGRRVVVDPCRYPEWVTARYGLAGIEQVMAMGETYRPDERFDECWVYNVLQHAEDPEAITATARASADAVRIFEWVDMPPVIGHPHTLTRNDLDRWLGGRGATVALSGENDCWGTAYYGVFR